MGSSESVLSSVPVFNDSAPPKSVVQSQFRVRCKSNPLFWSNRRRIKLQLRTGCSKFLTKCNFLCICNSFFVTIRHWSLPQSPSDIRNLSHLKHIFNDPNFGTWIQRRLCHSPLLNLFGWNHHGMSQLTWSPWLFSKKSLKKLTKTLFKKIGNLLELQKISHRNSLNLIIKNTNTQIALKAHQCLLRRIAQHLSNFFVVAQTLCMRWFSWGVKCKSNC